MIFLKKTKKEENSRWMEQITDVYISNASKIILG